MSESYVLALDLGTTGNRAIAFDKQGNIRAKAYREFKQYMPQPGWVEHDALEIWETTLKVAREVCRAVGVENIACLGITNQRETTVVWDRATGRPFYHAIVWQCRRTTEMCQGFAASKDLIRQKTGLLLDPYFSATKIRWILDKVPGVREKAAQGEALFGTVETWVLWNLTKGRSHLTEPSNASRTMIYNIRDMEFDDELLGLFGIPRAMLPQVKDSAADFGGADPEIFGREIPVTGMLGDQQAALFAHNAFQPGVVKSTYGTGIFIVANAGNRVPSVDGLLSTVAWRLDGKTAYALEGSIFMGGATLQWLRDNLKMIASAPESEGLAVSLKDNEGVYFVPAFQGLGAPYWDPEARGLIIGLSRRTGREAIARAALESLAYQTQDVVNEMRRALEGGLSSLRVDGGACANNFLMQFLSDILQLKVERPKVVETTALGAAGVAGLKAGFWTLEEFGKARQVDRIFQPQMPGPQAKALYVKWQDAVARSRGWA